jgi:uncharacterized membrane protein YgcG
MLSRRTASVFLIAALTLAAFALPAQAALRHIDGTVVSRNADNHSFRISTQNGNRLRIRVTSSTRFERLPGGFASLQKGLRVEVDARSTATGLVATQVETRGGGGGNDDGGGDDHGGSGGGGDDGPNHT